MRDLLNVELLTLHDIADLLALLSETDHEIAPLKANTLRYYVITGKYARQPFLTTEFIGNMRVARRADVMAWIVAYKAAPKLGRRGDGSKQPKNHSTRRSVKQQKGKRQ